MLAVMAGEGSLPGHIIDQLELTGRSYQLCELEGFPYAFAGDRPVLRFRLESLGSFIALLVSQGVTHICFAGSVARPALDPAALDAATMPLVPRMLEALQAGDDAALRVLLSFFEEAGITPVGAHELCPDLLPDPGVMGAISPEPRHLKDAARGREVIAAMAAADVGQSCIIARGQALAIEAMPGTDWMMQTLAMAARPLSAEGSQGPQTQRRGDLPEGGVLVKTAKPGQDLRIDMPVIGPDTVRRAAEIGLDGIVVEAGQVMVLDPAHAAALADECGIFVMVQA